MNANRKELACIALVVVMLAGCSTFNLGDVTPKTVDEGVATAFVALTTANQQFTELVKGQVFAKEDAERISNGLDEAGVFLRDAKTLLKDNRLKEADDYLKLATDLIGVIQRELSTKQ